MLVARNTRSLIQFSSGYLDSPDELESDTAHLNEATLFVNPFSYPNLQVRTSFALIPKTGRKTHSYGSDYAVAHVAKQPVDVGPSNKLPKCGPQSVRKNSETRLRVKGAGHPARKCGRIIGFKRFLRHLAVSPPLRPLNSLA